MERSPSAVRTSADGIVSGPSVVCSVSERSRPDGVGVPDASTTRAVAPSLLWMVRAPSSIGPQRWYGECLSHGSGRETRYGTAAPYTSTALAVRPPDVEKYCVLATWPP